MASSSRDTIALLVRGLEPSDTYNRKAWTKIYDLALERGCDLLMVSGQVIDDPNPIDRAHAAVFRLLNAGFIDGAVLSPTVTNRATAERLVQFDRELGNLPLVTTSVRVGGRPLYSVDNTPGIESAVRHLIEVHGCRRIVHVRGPHPDLESAQREAGWRRQLERAGITPLPEWLVPGSFDFEGLETIGQDILDRVGRDFDAVVACNDVAAHRVMQDFQARGIRVPQDVLVCGFDDIEKSQHSSPSLTTVRQPVADVIKLAWDALDELLSGHRPEDRAAPAGLVVRESCGCPRENWGPDPFPQLSAIMPHTMNETLGLMTHYEQRMETFQAAVYDLHNFIRAMNRVTEVDQLAPVLHDWLPRLGVKRFAILRTATQNGDPKEHVCQWEEGVLLPTAPQHFAVLTAVPSEDAQPLVSDEFSFSGWFASVSPFVMGLFPLVTGDTWYGMAILELSRGAGLLELILQEQLASTLDRVAREKRFRETETLRQFASEVAHEINTPLGALVSAHGIIRLRLNQVSDDWLEFVHTLSKGSRQLFTQLYHDLWKTSRKPLTPASLRAKTKHWTALLTGLIDDPVHVAEDLATVGFAGTDEQLRKYSTDKEFTRVLASAARLSDLPHSIAVVGLASEKIAVYVNQLRKSLL